MNVQNTNLFDTSGYKILLQLESIYYPLKIIRNDSVPLSFDGDLLPYLQGAIYRLLGYLPASLNESPIFPFVANMDVLLNMNDSISRDHFKTGTYNIICGLFDQRDGLVKSTKYWSVEVLDSKLKSFIADKGIVWTN